jgi:hypothetical protein
LVYAEALNRFAKYDSTGPWCQLADGITAAAIHQCWPKDDPRRAGLLPATFLLGPQLPAGPSINPAVVQIAALRYYRQPLAYDFHVFRKHGLLVHAPGELVEMHESSEGIAFTVKTWSKDPSSLLVNGFTKEPRLRLNGQEVPIGSPHKYQSGAGRLELELLGSVRVEIVCPVVHEPEVNRSGISTDSTDPSH